MEEFSAHERVLAHGEQVTLSLADIPRHLLLKDLPQKEQFPRLRAARKQFSDTLKLIA